MSAGARSPLAWTDPRHPWMEDVLVLDVDEMVTPDSLPPNDRRCLYCDGPLVGFQLRFCCYAHRDRHGKERRPPREDQHEPAS